MYLYINILTVYNCNISGAELYKGYIGLCGHKHACVYMYTI